MSPFDYATISLAFFGKLALVSIGGAALLIMLFRFYLALSLASLLRDVERFEHSQE